MHYRGLLTIVCLSAATLSSAAAINKPNESKSTTTNQFTNATQQVSQVPFGAVITHCAISGTIALTFDDGPFIYTVQLLETLSQHGARATFFLNGVNRGSIDAFLDLVQRTLHEGHQLGSHT